MSNNTAATPSYSGHLLIETRHALIVDAEVTTADGYATGPLPSTLTALPKPTTAHRGRRKRDDTRGFFADGRGLGFTPHVAQ